MNKLLLHGELKKPGSVGILLALGIGVGLTVVLGLWSIITALCVMALLVAYPKSGYQLLLVLSPVFGLTAGLSGAKVRALLGFTITPWDAAFMAVSAGCVLSEIARHGHRIYGSGVHPLELLVSVFLGQGALLGLFRNGSRVVDAGRGYFCYIAAPLWRGLLRCIGPERFVKTLVWFELAFFPLQVILSVSEAFRVGARAFGLAKPDLYVSPGIHLLILPLAVGLARKPHRLRGVAVISAVLAFLGVLLSLGRSFLVGLLVEMPLLYISAQWYSRPNRTGRKLATVTLSSVLLLVAVCLSYISGKQGFQRALSGTDPSTQYRLVEMQTIPRYILRKPLLGYGLGASLPTELSRFFPTSSHPWWVHNEPMAVAYSLGLPGAVIFYYWLIRESTRAQRLMRQCGGRLDIYTNAIATMIGCGVPGVLAAGITGGQVTGYGLAPAIVAGFALVGMEQMPQ